MSAEPVTPLHELLLTERENWPDGPPHALFKELRGQCPVHWTSKITEYPDEAGFWSVTTADDVHAVSRDWETYSSATGITAADQRDHAARARSRRCSSGWTRPSTTASRRSSSAASRPSASPSTRTRSARSRVGVLDRLEGRETCDLVTDVAQPVVSRVIGSFMGIPPEDDAVWARLMNTTLGAGDPDINPEGVETVMQRDVPEIFERCAELIAAAPREPDRRPDERARARRDRRRAARGARDRHGLLPARGGRQRQHQGDLLQRDARAAWRTPTQRAAAARRPVAGAERGRGVAAHVPRLRALPPHGHARRRAQRRPDQEGREGRHVVRVVEPRRDALRGPRPLRRDAATPSTRPSAPAAGTSASARRWPGSSCGCCSRRRCERFPDMELDGSPVYVESPFINQLKTLPVRLRG